MKFRIFALIVLIQLGAMGLVAQTANITYQGNLRDGANPANGSYDFEFVIFDAATGGNQLGLVTRSPVTVVNGAFAVLLDLNAGLFPGADRFLEIRVRNMGGSAFIPLTGRQRFNSSPYAIKTLTAENAVSATTVNNALQLGGIAPSQYMTIIGGGTSFIQNTTSPQASSNFNISGSGTIGGNLTVNGLITANLPAGDPDYVQNRTSVQTGTNFNVSGAATANTFAATQFNGGNFNGALFAGSIFSSINGFYQGNVRILNTAGTNNTFAGRLSGTANTGTDNSFFGFNSGNNNTSAANNTFVGSEAGSLNTTADANTFIGAAAGKNNILGSNSTFVGTAAGFTSSGGFRNTFVGRSAGRLNVDASANTFVGFEAGRATTSSDNSFFGQLSGDSNTSGINNAFFGPSSGSSNLDGTGNALFGRNAGFANISGSANSFFGYGTGLNATGGNNTFLGTSAGNTNTTGGNNTMIGAGANVGSPGLNYATAIGADAVVNNGNTVVIGRSNDTVRIPGTLRIPGIGFDPMPSPLIRVCVNASGILYKCPSNLPSPELVCMGGGSVFNPLMEVVSRCNSTAATEPKKIDGANSERNYIVLANTINERQAYIEAQKKLIERQNAHIDALMKLMCAANKDAEICREK